MITALTAILSTGLFANAEARNTARKVTDASDARITYVGRVAKNSTGVSFDWSGVQCRLKFDGPYVALHCSDTKSNYYNVWFDKDTGCSPDIVIRTAGTDTLIVLSDKLGRGVHELTLQKRTEGEQGMTTFHHFETAGEVLQADPVKERYIEFIGDSYTCGFGTENSVRTDKFKPETENCNLTYAAIISRYFNADYNLVCHSGRGVVRNYDDWGKGIPETTVTGKYSNIYDEGPSHACPAPEIIPDIVVIYLGANDFSTEMQPSMEEFCKGYISLLGKVRERYGNDVPLLCIAARLDPGIFAYVREACRRSGLDNIWSMAMQDGVHNLTSDLGASWHPNYSGQKKMASQIIPYVSTITGWEMEVKAYR